MKIFRIFASFWKWLTACQSPDSYVDLNRRLWPSNIEERKDYYK